MSGNPNYWKLMGTVKKLKEKDNLCFVCGSKKDIVPHYLKRLTKQVMNITVKIIWYCCKYKCLKYYLT